MCSNVKEQKIEVGSAPSRSFLETPAAKFIVFISGASSLHYALENSTWKEKLVAVSLTECLLFRI